MNFNWQEKLRPEPKPRTVQGDKVNREKSFFNQESMWPYLDLEPDTWLELLVWTPSSKGSLRSPPRREARGTSRVSTVYRGWSVGINSAQMLRTSFFYFFPQFRNPRAPLLANPQRSEAPRSVYCLFPLRYTQKKINRYAHLFLTKRVKYNRLFSPFIDCLLL